MDLVKPDDEKYLDSFQELIHDMDYTNQFFGFPPYSNLMQFKRCVLQKIKSGMLHAEKSILKRSDDHEKEKTHDIIKKLIDKYEAAVEISFQKLEPKYLSLFKIPVHVLLPEDAIHANVYTANDVKEIDEEIEQYQNRYKRAICMEALLSKEKHEGNNIFILEKKLMELEDGVNAISSQFERKKETWCEIKNVSAELNSLIEEIKTIKV